MPGPNDGKAESGAKIFKAKCATCHTCNEGGPNKQGPNLFGVLGRQSGQVAGFKYTDANKNSGIQWSNQVRAAAGRGWSRIASSRPAARRAACRGRLTSRPVRVAPGPTCRKRRAARAPDRAPHAGPT